jgi:chitinase
MPGTGPPRNAIYVNGIAVSVQQPDGSTASIPYPYISSFSYTDAILGFLIPDPSGNGNLIGDGSVLPSDPSDPLGPYLQGAIAGFHNAGQNALVSVGGACGWVPDPTNCPYSTINYNAWEYYSNNVSQLVEQIVSFVQQYGFNGVDIDYEDDNGFVSPSPPYSGIQFLIDLTSQLAQALPPGQNIITHAPQTPYWDTNWNNAPYAQIWQAVGNQITWINNQFYDNPAYDQYASLQVQWYNTIAGIMGGARQLLLGVILDPGSDGYLPIDQLSSNVIAPLEATYGPGPMPSTAGTNFGGWFAWEWSLDTNWVWTNAVAPPPAENAAKLREQRGSLRVDDPLLANIIGAKLGSRARPHVPVRRSRAKSA